ncbi:MAG TPA: hydroxyphenylacetyl-CoA thioesterase PaaI [Magnetospirillum sp.]|nr:hydroxyphenylacetyl-CoA thioesterase PaaI [Magnetospirillum sp.]
MPHPHPDRQALAERVAAAMQEKDESLGFLGITLDAVGPGHARLSMTVTRPMLNALGLCHGGFTYKLADDAFAYACNSHNRNAVGLNCTISYLAPAREGDRLTATCDERHRKGRSGTYDVTVTNQDGETIALFRGLCRVVEGSAVE